MTDIQAAIGREQLKRLPAIVARRRELAARYEERLQSIDGVIVPREPAVGAHQLAELCDSRRRVDRSADSDAADARRGHRDAPGRR